MTDNSQKTPDHGPEKCCSCVPEIEKMLAAERQKARDSGYHAGYCAAKSKFEREGHCNYHRRLQREAESRLASLTADNERLKIKATNWEIVAAGFEEWAIHLRDEINEALSFGPTYKPELKGWVAQFVEWQKRMRESLWIKKPEALTSPQDGLTAEQVKVINNGFWQLTADPQEKKEPAYDEAGGQASWATKTPPSEDDEPDEYRCNECGERKAPWASHDCNPKGDSAGPEKSYYGKHCEEEMHLKVIEDLMDDNAKMEAVIEAARSHGHYVSNKGCMVCSALKALDRARGEGKSDGH